MYISISSFQKIPWPFSNSPSLKTFEGCNCENMGKIHWKLMTFESQYRFANISATKTRIFMKFETYIHKILKNYLLIFHKDPCTYARTRGKNMRTRVWSRQNTRVHIYASWVCVCAQIFTKNLLIILYYLMNVSLKFHKVQSFRCRDICKTILTFKNHQFAMYFTHFNIFAPRKSSKWENYWMIINFLAN